MQVCLSLRFLLLGSLVVVVPLLAETAAGGRPLPVKVMPLASRPFVRQLQLQGSVQSKTTVVVSSRLDGTLAEVAVDEGDRVEAGKTLLFRLDALRRRQGLELARQAVAARRSGLRLAEAGVAKAGAELKKATADKARYDRLRAIQAATAHEQETFTTLHEQAVAGFSYAEAAVAAAAAEVDYALAALAVAERDLSDTDMVAPISGVVVSRRAEPGEEVARNHEILRIEDTSLLEAVASLPGSCYFLVVPGQSRLQLETESGPVGEYLITYRSPVVESTLRTFQIKALVPNQGATPLVPGSLLTFRVVLEQRDAFGVPGTAIVARRDGPQIFVVEAGRARAVPVARGLETAGWTAVSGDALREGMPVIVEGQFLLNDGDPVAVQE